MAVAGGQRRAWLRAEAAAGLALMAAAALALAVANSPLAGAYFGALGAHLGPLSLLHWINDGLMAGFFLLVGLEIKRELLAGALASWRRRVLPGIAALGGMVVPALVFLAIAGGETAARRAWAVPAATDIAFALGVLALLGPRVPASLKVFLTALAILDDLGAIALIAVFYAGALSGADLLGAGLVLAALGALNRAGVGRLWPYLLLGAVLWALVLRSGVHATVAGVALAFCVPLRAGPAGEGPLQRLEHRLHPWITWLVVPVFGFANAGVSFAGVTAAALWEPLTLGVAAGLVLGKVVGVFGSTGAAIGLGLARLPAGAGWGQLLGVSLLCGIGFTMSLFIGTLAFQATPALLERVKFGVLGGSVLAGAAGAAVLAVAGRRVG